MTDLSSFRPVPAALRGSISRGALRRELVVSLALTASYALSPSETVRFGLVVALAVVASLSPLRALQSLWLLALLLLINPGLLITGTGPSIEAGRWLVVGSALVGSIRRQKRAGLSSTPRPYISRLHLGFIGIAIVGSLLTSPNLTLSMAKIVAWTLGTLAVLLASARLDESDRQHFLRWLRWILLMSIASSLLLGSSNLGYLNNGRDFQGILNQPQALGVFLAPIVVGCIVAAVQYRSPGWLLAALVTGGMLFSSNARGAALATLLGMLVMAGVTLVTLRGSLFARRASASVATAVAVGCVALLVAFPHVMGPVQEFAYGGRDPISTDLEEAVNRVHLVEASVENFQSSFVFGIGFGIASDTTSQEVNTFVGLPVGAATEKGVIVSAVLEETGVLGAMWFFAFLWELLRLSWRKNGPLGLGIVFGALATNLGEATLLSPGGAGLYVWLIVGVGAFIPLKELIRPRDQQRRPAEAPVGDRQPGRTFLATD